jgi:hypothetical protein
MAITAPIMTSFGEERECYIRLNSMSASNHGIPASALFRAFLSKEAFQAGSHYVAEFNVEFTADVSAPLWEQAYVALIEQEQFEDAGEA